jgi:hypothetical protein
MALDSGGLIAALAAVFQAFPPTSATCASGMAAAYTAYASAGMFGSSTIVVTGANTSALEGLLLAAIAVPLTGNPASFGAAWAAGLTAFWTAPPIAVTGGQTGVVTAIPGAPAVAGAITAAAAVLGNTAPGFAAVLGGVLHTATLTTTATVAPPPGTVLPIS